MSGAIDEDYCKEQTQRIRLSGLISFTRRGLLALVGRYALRAAGPLKAAERLLPVRATPPGSILSGSGEA
ncbi:hypothetical protein ACKWRH_33550 [Bradyrhizobium sp. Pa8]|uniref:hypothetical protein n=1 Tax=Bradyrhizobium sp. Pa8 TaxID=3386552 RepID=UPI00403F0C50